MESEIKSKFYEIAKEFKNDQFDLKTVARIIIFIRSERKDLTAQEARLLLQIPINVLENDIELINKPKWVEENGSYFVGNITWADNEFTDKWKTRFSKDNFGLADMVELCKIIADDFDKYRSCCEFVLRNPEVTLRNDVKLKKSSNFNYRGELYYEEILKAL